jgi:hypothetical protein
LTEHAGRLLGHIGQTFKGVGPATRESHWWSMSGGTVRYFRPVQALAIVVEVGFPSIGTSDPRYHSCTGMWPLLERRGDQRTGG